MLNLLRRLIFGQDRKVEQPVVAESREAHPPVSSTCALLADCPVTEHPPFALAGAKACQDGIAECRNGTPLQVEPDGKGGFQFRIEGGAVVGKITSRHCMAKYMAEPFVVLHAAVNCVSDTLDQSGLLAPPTVRLVTGPEGATWSPLPPEPKRSYPAEVVGESFYQQDLIDCQVGEPVHLFHEPDNPHDAKAIAIVSIRDKTIGYLPRDSWLRRPLLTERKDYSAAIESIGRKDKFVGVVITVRLEGEEIGTRPFSRT